MFTKEAILNASSHSRYLAKNGHYLKGVLTSEEAQFKLDNTQSCSVMVISTLEIFFFTDDYCLGIGVLPKEFVSSSTQIPHRVKERPSLPDGQVKNVEDYINIYERYRLQITSIDELIEFLNQNDRRKL